MFQLTDHTATLAKLTTRTEKHGDEDVPAASLRLRVAVASSMLDLFHPSIKKTFYCKPRVGDQQSIPFDKGDDRTAIAIPEITEIHWDAEYPGYGLSIGVDLEASQPVALSDVTLSKFGFKFIEGGSAIVEFSVGGTPSGEQVARLYDWQGQDLQLTLTPPSTSAQQKAA